MALSSKKEPLVPDLHADPEFRQAEQLLSAFKAKLATLNDTILMLTLERDLVGRPSDDKSMLGAEIRARHAWLRASLATEAVGQAGAHASADKPEIVAGLMLLRGERQDPTPDIPARIAKIREDVEVILAAIRAQSDVVETIRDRKSFELAERLRKHHDGMLLQAYRAAQELAVATTAIQSLHAEFHRRGYGAPRSDILPPVLTRGGQLLGRESDWSSDIAMTRRTLEARGIMP